jgi:hypothetical protein
MCSSVSVRLHHWTHLPTYSYSVPAHRTLETELEEARLLPVIDHEHNTNGVLLLSSTCLFHIPLTVFKALSDERKRMTSMAPTLPKGAQNVLSFKLSNQRIVHFLSLYHPSRSPRWDIEVVGMASSLCRRWPSSLSSLS